MVRASVPGGMPPAGPAWTVRSVTVGGRDVTDRGFDISSGGASDVAIAFTSAVSELSGTLMTPAGDTETDYFVIVMPADREYWLPNSRRIASTRPDGKGRYVFRGLPGGDYRIAVTTDLVPRDLQEVSTLEQLFASPRAQGKFKLGEGTLSNVDLVATMQSETAGSRAGVTKFNELAGSLSSNEQRAVFQNVSLEGGVLKGNGTVEVGSNSNVAGRAIIEIRSKVASDRGSFGVSGTVSRPILKRGG